MENQIHTLKIDNILKPIEKTNNEPLWKKYQHGPIQSVPKNEIPNPAPQYKKKNWHKKWDLCKFSSSDAWDFKRMVMKYCRDNNLQYRTKGHDNYHYKLRHDDYYHHNFKNFDTKDELITYLATQGYFLEDFKEDIRK